MVTFLADENLNNNLIRALSRRRPGIDLQRVQDVGLRTHSDEEIIEYAVAERRILLTHDVRTIEPLLEQRRQLGLELAGVLYIQQGPISQVVIEDILLIDSCTETEEWLGKSYYLPLPATL